MTSADYDPRDESPIDAQLAAPPPLSDPETTSGQDPASSTMFADLIQNRGAVLAVLFLATGALGIPLLWMNQRFGKGERIFWSVVVTLYTLVLIAAVGWICLWSYRRITGA